MLNADRIDSVASYENARADPRSIDSVRLNGRLVMMDDGHRAAKPGQVLRDGGYRVSPGARH